MALEMKLALLILIFIFIYFLFFWISGRLVNIHSFSVNTIASVLKKFLRKIPGGIFGPANEALLFEIFDLQTDQEKLAVVQR